MSRFSKLLLISIGFFVLLASFPATVFAGNPPDPAHSTLNATLTNSDTAPADGVTTAKMTLTLHDASNVPLNGDTVSFAIPSDPTAVITPSTTTVDSSGIALITITSTTIGTDPINVTDVTTSTTLTALGQVIFTAVVTPTPTSTSAPAPASSSNNSGGGSSYSAPQCTIAAPKDAPNLFLVTPGKTTATLKWGQPAEGPFDSYTISYGLTESADTYNTSFSLGNSTTAIQYIIQDLAPKTTYFFKVRANNGCATGPWSPVRKEGYAGPKLPVAGPESIFLGIGLGGIVAMIGGMALFFVL